MTLDVRSIGFIGAGRLAASLAAALRGAGYPVSAMASHHAESARQLAASVSCNATTPGAVAQSCDLVFLTVPDAHIAPLAASLPWRPGQAVTHCSGALARSVLGPASARGALTSCIHPLQSFPSRTPEASRFQGIHCGIEAPDPLGRYLQTLTRALGATPFSLEGVDRRLYHSAAVFMSNHVVALASAATRLWSLAGLPEDSARTALAPLLLSATANVANLPLRHALTGPVARGDSQTIEGHLRALESNPDLRALYRALSAELLHLNLDHAPEVARKLAALLTDLDSPSPRRGEGVEG